MRLSQTLKDKEDSKSLLKEKTMNLAEISKHSYLRKSKSKLIETQAEDNLVFNKIEVL